MEYVYAALLLHAAKKEVAEAAVTKVLEAAGEKPDASRVKALVASLKDVNIDEAVKKAAVAPAAAAPVAGGEAKAEAKKEEKAADKGKTEEEAAEGLSSLFG